MKSYKEKIEILSNVLTIIIAILFIGIFIKWYFLPNQPTAPTPTIGKTISIKNLDTSKSNKNLLLVIMKGCRFCESSMGFYKSLIEQYHGKKANIIAVFPPDSKDIENYLKNQGITGIEIKYSKLADLEVDGTPTLIATDENGKITKYWLGQLLPEEEKEVIDFINS
jgi:thioredoxin-related protein